MNLPVHSSLPLLALDPSSTKIGWALIGAGPTYLASNVMTLPDAPSNERVLMVGGAVRQIILNCPHRPASALIEIPDYIASYVNTANIVMYFRAVGIAEYEVHLHGLPIKYVKASKLKQNAGEEQAKARFRALVRRHPYTDDESDAVSIGWDHVAALTPRPHGQYGGERGVPEF